MSEIVALGRSPPVEENLERRLLRALPEHHLARRHLHHQPGRRVHRRHVHRAALRPHVGRHSLHLPWPVSAAEAADGDGRVVEARDQLLRGPSSRAAEVGRPAQRPYRPLLVSLVAEEVEVIRRARLDY